MTSGFDFSLVIVKKMTTVPFLKEMTTVPFLKEMNVFTFEDTVLNTPSYLTVIPHDITRYLKCFVFGTFFKYHEAAISGKFLYERETEHFIKTRELWEGYRETILPHRKLNTKEMVAICSSILDMFPTIVGKKYRFYKELAAILIYHILLVETDISKLGRHTSLLMAIYPKIRELGGDSRVLGKYFCPRWDYLIERVWVFVDDQDLDHCHKIEEEPEIDDDSTTDDDN